MTTPELMLIAVACPGCAVVVRARQRTDRMRTAIDSSTIGLIDSLAYSL
jgi:hypothetical protein